MTRRFDLCSIVVSAIALTPTALAQPEPDEGDLWPAVSAAGQLKLSPVGLDPADPLQNIVVLPSTAGLLQGWSSNEPGFDDVEADDLTNDAFTFAPGGFIRVEVLSLDPALLVWTPGLQLVPAGGSAALGSTDSDVHTHLIWHIRSNTPEFDADRTFWRGTFRLIDTGNTAYAPSLPFTLYFSRVDCRSGDVSGDGEISFFDIDPFLLALFDTPNATDVQKCAADVNRDGGVDFFDIDPFLAVLFQ